MVDSKINATEPVGLPGAQGKEELEELVSTLVTMPLDPIKPLWDIHLVDHYQGGSAVVWRIHHCYGDGIALIHVVLSITEKAPHSPLTTTSPPPLDTQRHEDEEARTDIFRQVLEPVSEALRQAVNTGRDLLGEGVDIALHPAQTVDQARRGIGAILGYAHQGLGFVSEATRLLFLADDSPTRFKGKLGVAKRVAWSEPLPLEEVRLIGKALGATINDVLLSCVTGALRSYLLEKGDPVDSTLEIRSAVPVNLRPQGQAEKLGNYFGMVLLPLPVGVENPLERLAAVHRRMDDLRTSYQAIMTIGVMGILGLGPPLAQALAMRMLSKKATAVTTNVPGSPEPLYLAGSQITEWMFWVPQSGSVGMGVSIITYGGHVHFGLITDRKRISDPETIIRRFGNEFEKLVLMTMIGPWDQELDPKRWVEFIKAQAHPTSPQASA